MQSMSIRITAAVLAFCPALSLAQSLFHPATVAKSASAPEALVAPVAVEMDFAALQAAQAGTTLDAVLPNGRTVSLVFDFVEHHSNGDVSWRAVVQDGVRADLRAVGTTGTSGTFAEIHTADGSWGISPAPSGGHEWLFDRNATEANLPPAGNADDARIPPNRPVFLATKAACPDITSMPSAKATVDVLVVMAPDFVSTQGGAAGAETRLNYLFNTINSYFVASNIAITYRRVATMTANYQAAATANDDDTAALDAITNNTGVFANVEAIRKFYGADMVTLLRGPKGGGNSISGIAWVTGDTNGNLNPWDAAYMYSVAGDWTFPSATVFAHEMGHNLGNNHDRPNAVGATSGSTTYSFGHYVCGSGASASCGQAGINSAGTGFGTIMAYERPTVAKFSSPYLTCQGTQAGALSAACGVANLQDDVRATNCVRQTVAAFNASWVGTCTNLSQDTDGDGIPDCLEAGSGKVSGTKDNDIFATPLLFAAQQYRDFLSREADADGLNFWTSAVASGQYPRPNAIEQFFGSGEFQGTIAPVARLYFAYFRRIPDYAGLQYWIGQFRGGTPLDGISQQFAQSAEFTQTYGALDNTQFVTLVYQNVLARAPDAPGLSYWVDQLNRGLQSRGTVMTGFSESAEYKNASFNKVYVTMMYVGMMRRSPDSGGFDYWVGYLGQGNSGLALINGFLGAPEYYHRFLP